MPRTRPQHEVERFGRLMAALTTMKRRDALSDFDMRVYEAETVDIPLPLLTTAVDTLLKTSVWFPTVAELREACDVARRALPLPKVVGQSLLLSAPLEVQVPGSGQRIPITREWRYHCEACSDTGWKSWWCGDAPPNPWMERGRCQRETEHLAHEWVAECQCRDSNPSVLRKREAQARMAAQRQAAAQEKRR
jgi:hypothetical protein